VDRAGSGATAFWNNIAGNYLTSKTFHVVPTTNNASAQYTITLYYSAAEKAGWELATGNSWNNIKIVKVKSQISNYAPATPNPDGPGAWQIVTPILGTYGSDYTLTATFSSGFSGFAAGIPGINPLPLTLVKFDGKLNGKSALLQWTTASEQNTKNFDIEKSTDGTNYYKLGSVKAAGNSAVNKDYSFTDQQLSPNNYYRLRMNDIDGRNVLSQVVLLRVGEAPQQVWVLNNPFSDHLDLRFASRWSSAKLQLINSSGSVVAEETIRYSGQQSQWRLPDHLSRGSYLLRTYVDGLILTNKIVKQ
jgi:hypothetical protein